MNKDTVCPTPQADVKSQLKHQLMQQMEQEIQSLLQWVQEEEPTATLHDLEKEAQNRAFKIARLALQQRLSAPRGYVGGHRPCGCGASQQFEGYRRRCVETLVGSVCLQRAYYWCEGCGQSATPADTLLRVEGGQFSEGMRKVICWAGAQMPFAKAAEGISECSGGRLKVSASTVRRLSEQVGGEITLRWEQERLRAERGVKRVQAPPPPRLEMEADGAMIPTTEGWREAKVGSVVSYRADEGVQQAVVFARVHNHERFGNRLWLEAHKQGLETAQAVAAIGDGAAWVWNQFSVVCSRAVQISDYYHVKKRLYEMAQAHYGEGSERVEGWVKGREKELFSKQPGAAIAAVKRLRPRTAEGKAKRKETLRYLETNRARLRYRAFRAGGWSIGSGRVEGAARTFVGMRMKGGGGKWKVENAQFILDLRSKIEYGGWDSFWEERFGAN